MLEWAVIIEVLELKRVERVVGRVLLQLKDQVPAGDWSDWVRDLGLSAATADRCIRQAEWEQAVAPNEDGCVPLSVFVRRSEPLV